MRTGTIEDGVVLEAGAPFKLLAADVLGDGAEVSISYPTWCGSFSPEARSSSTMAPSS